MTIFGRITGGGGAGSSKPAIKVNKVLVYLLINGLVSTQTLEPTPFGQICSFIAIRLML